MESMDVLKLIMEAGGGIVFPIAMCLMLFWYIKDEQGKTREVLNKLENTIETLKTTVEILVKKREE